MWIPFRTVCLLTLLLLVSQQGQSAPGTERPVQYARSLSRSIGFNKAGRTTTPKPVYKWRPSEDTRLSLAIQKGIPADNVQDTDPEFQFLWPDDYYDDYDFEHQRNMIQHGTWEAKRLKYHEAQLQEAREALTGEKPGIA